MIVLGIDIGPDTCGVALVDVAAVGRSRMLWGKVLPWDAAAEEAQRQTLVALECPEEVHQGIVRLRGPGAMRSAARHIGDCKRVAGRIEGLLLARGVAHETTTARVVRKDLFARPAATDHEVRERLRLWCDLIPRTNCHVRDAVAVAVWLGRRRQASERYVVLAGW